MEQNTTPGSAQDPRPSVKIVGVTDKQIQSAFKLPLHEIEEILHNCKNQNDSYVDRVDNLELELDWIGMDSFNLIITVIA